MTINLEFIDHLLERRNALYNDLRRAILKGIIAVAIFTVVMVIFACVARADEVNLDIISKIESNNNPLAYNYKSKAIGLYQITSICLNDYNLVNNTCYELTDLLSAKFNQKIAIWYFKKRIPQLLKYFGLSDTLENRLWAYNVGIGKVVKGIMPKETQNYIKRYKQLARQK